MKPFLCFTLLIFIFFRCENSKKQDYKASNTFKIEKAQIHPGKRLMKVHCYACHDATTSEENRVV